MTYRRAVSGVGIAESDEDLLLLEEVLTEAIRNERIAQQLPCYRF
jgi:hypothetical protein